MSKTIRELGDDEKHPVLRSLDKIFMEHPHKARAAKCILAEVRVTLKNLKELDDQKFKRATKNLWRSNFLERVNMPGRFPEAMKTHLCNFIVTLFRLP